MCRMLTESAAQLEEYCLAWVEGVLLFPLSWSLCSQAMSQRERTSASKDPGGTWKPEIL